MLTAVLFAFQGDFKESESARQRQEKQEQGFERIEEQGRQVRNNTLNV